MVIQLMRVAYAENDLAAGMLYLASYAFMLRVPSEALPMIAGENALVPLLPNTHSCISVTEDELVLRLARRKNKPDGAIIRRSCCCEKSKHLCPVHVLGKWMKAQATGNAPFAQFSASFARSELKRRLAKIGIADAEQYVLHDMRRGHAQDLVESGCSLHQILKAGEWVSPAFLKYLDLAKVDRDSVVQAHVAESDSEG
jgi:hypothetical protein